MRRVVALVKTLELLKSVKVSFLITVDYFIIFDVLNIVFKLMLAVSSDISNTVFNLILANRRFVAYFKYCIWPHILHLNNKLLEFVAYQESFFIGQNSRSTKNCGIFKFVSKYLKFFIWTISSRRMHGGAVALVKIHTKFLISFFYISNFKFKDNNLPESAACGGILAPKKIHGIPQIKKFSFF